MTPSAPTPASPASPPETVVLLHGLALAAWAMERLAWSLRAAGWRVVNLSYPSRTVGIRRLAAEWLPAQLARHRVPADDGTLHFVTHSMGGIVLRAWLETRGGPPASLRRVVMFAPPNHGTPLVDGIRGWWVFRSILHDNGCHLGTGPDSVPRQLGPWPAGPELGIIAGQTRRNPIFGRWLREPSDGKVPVASTRLAGMRDHLVLPCSHTFIQYHGPAIAQALTFLREGRFRRG